MAQPTASLPSFEAASIRAGDAIARGGRIATGPGSLTITNIPLRGIVEWAFDIQPAQFQGPGWLGDTRFSITAKAADAANDDRLRLMLQSLLVDRFAMKLHHDRKEVATYALTLAKSGAKFHEPGPKDPSKFVESKTEGSAIFTGDKTGMIAERAYMSGIAEKLSEPLQRPVIDKTGLAARYDIRLDITPYLLQDGGDSGGGGRQIDPMSVIFTALQGQLGLKVEPSKDVVDFLVIDSASKVPSDN
ncbi:MAG: TIGR03435 family protein [Terriglobia bacterium]